MVRTKEINQLPAICKVEFSPSKHPSLRCHPNPAPAIFARSTCRYSLRPRLWCASRFRLSALNHSDINTAAIRRLAHAYAYRIPQLPVGEILITRGNPDDSEAIAPLNLLKELIEAEKPRLDTYQAARQTYIRESAASQAAHPPAPQDETILLRPHRGSRYRVNPQPEKQGTAR